ncbi:pilus assembly protein [Ideonella sp. 4Y11]|uniref:Pilus assembly protein n=1 Tax=Ideonella aquatica TaxID=2824119 RepID=A0A941BM12_9BURK|nr:TadE/TadG family type IV pilus assembly protein [Ideonella aquatica]MBQ0960314.1 pilus assembly protein [Ideonella aquatica]
MKPASARRRQQGASLVEFVIVFPFAVLFTLSLIQAGFVFMAKTTLNHATFMAARVGAVHNASRSAMTDALARGLSPFYQDGSRRNDHTRLAMALAEAQVDTRLFSEFTVLSPSPEAFADFGVRDPVRKLTYIPNDNLAFRSQAVQPKSKMNLRDANLLKIKVVYGYEMKVPLMAGVVRRVMCGGDAGVDAWGDVSIAESAFGLSNPLLCARYYRHGRLPIEAYALVEMQSPAYQP